jgi:isocitrate dehydrogenase kinase/phosphatase
VIDAALFGEDELLMIFSYARAYFMVEMEIPSAYVQFLRGLMPRKPRAELYNSIGLQKHGKNLFYRDFMAHQRHSSDPFRIAPGIKGMVMLVFDLPSFPYVFKVIKDFYPPQKDTTREQIKGKYLLVKQHDRVGRMADTLEYSNVAFPRHRFEEELIAELKHFCPSLLEDDGDALVIKHLYIERRMIPLNIHLQEADDEQMAHAVIEYGNAIKDLVAANIFPGDMLWKNFGVTRLQLPPRAAGAQRGRRDERRGLVHREQGRRLPRDLRPLPAGQRPGARGVHGAPRRPARPGVLAGPQGAHPRRARARRVPVRGQQALHAARARRRALSTTPAS